MDKDSQNKKVISKKKKIVFTFFSIFLSFCLTAAIGEIAIRTIDIPGIDMNTHYTLDPITGYRDIPHAKLFFRNTKGEVIRRRFNSFGYLDAEHKQKKEEGVYRIGFFGDSYVEARQVQLESTFFRMIEKELKDYNIECIALGQNGTGTLVAYLNNRRWMRYLDLDLIVYVFCENDLGDNIKEIREKTARFLPFAYLTNDGFQIDNSNLRFAKTLNYRLKTWPFSRFLLFRIIKSRVELLVKYGVKLKISDADRKMATKAKGDKMPDQNDLPSTWPLSLKGYAEKLASAIILKWANEVKTDSRGFTILYVPREGEVQKKTKKQDSWKPWIESLCRNNDIIFIDPTDSLLNMQYSGKEVFLNHFTTEGHEAFADAFVKWFRGAA